MTAPYTPLAIANTFIENFGRTDGIEHMKLQKLVYCSYGWWLAQYGLEHPRLTTEGPQIWKHGPVFDSLYHTLKVFGREPIKLLQSRTPFEAPERIDPDDTDVWGLLSWIWGRYGHLSSFALSDMTHSPGTPWHRVATENNFRIAFNTAIPDQYILEEYRRLLSTETPQSHQAGVAHGGGRTNASA